MDSRWLIVNADDLGLSVETNRGIFHAHQHGIVTSASLMLRAPAAPDAVDAARCFTKLGIGLHVDLGEWTYRDGDWREVYAVVPTNDLAAVRAEILRQLEGFRQIAGRDPTHLDSHQHVHRERSLRAIFQQIAQSVGVPLRGANRRVAFCGGFHGRARSEPFPEGITAANLCRLIHNLDAAVTELSCHPGFDRNLASDYREERVQEVKALCDPAVRAQVAQEQINLISFADLARVAT